MKKNLMDSQKELLAIKSRGVQNTLAQAQVLQTKLEETAKKIALELGIEDEDYANWKLSPDGEYFEKSGKK